MDGCYKEQGPLSQCCCDCRYHVAVHYHCTRDPEIRKATGGCVCGIRKGWACLGLIAEDGLDGGRIHDNWPEHSVGCEMHSPTVRADQEGE